MIAIGDHPQLRVDLPGFSAQLVCLMRHALLSLHLGAAVVRTSGRDPSRPSD